MSSPTKDNVSDGSAEVATSIAAMATAATVTTATVAMETAAVAAMTPAGTVTAAAFFDVVEDSDSSASSDILELNEVGAFLF